jgi:restriction system protein
MNDEKAIWGIHAGKTGDAETLFQENGVIALGWSEFGTLEGLETREEFKAKYGEVYTDVSAQSVAVGAGQLYRFVHEMNTDDLVVFSAKRERKVHIGKVEGEYRYRPNIDEGYPNQRAVKWIKKVPRTDFSQGALYEMGAGISLFQIKNYADEVVNVLEGREPVAADDEDAIALVAEDVEEQSRDFVLKQLERNLKGLPLEEFIQHLLERMGYNARLTRPNEPSVDLIAHKDELGFEPPIIKVQVKSSAGTIGDKDVSALYGKVDKDEFGLLITLGEFSPQAINFAGGKSNLRLIDGAELVNLIFEHYEDFNSRFKRIIPLKMVYIPQSYEGKE